MGAWVWPVVEDAESAREAAHLAAVWTMILAGLNVLAGVLTGLNVIVALVCVIYGVAAWRVWRGSHPWAIAAFVLCILQAILVVISLPLIWGIFMPFAFLALMNGVRGTASLQRLTEAEELKI
jgi:uncharacterized membrane protein